MGMQASASTLMHVGLTFFLEDIDKVSDAPAQHATCGATDTGASTWFNCALAHNPPFNLQLKVYPLTIFLPSASTHKTKRATRGCPRPRLNPNHDARLARLH